MPRDVESTEVPPEPVTQKVPELTEDDEATALVDGNALTQALRKAQVPAAVPTSSLDVLGEGDEVEETADKTTPALPAMMGDLLDVGAAPPEAPSGALPPVVAAAMRRGLLLPPPKLPSIRQPEESAATPVVTATLTPTAAALLSPRPTPLPPPKPPSAPPLASPPLMALPPVPPAMLSPLAPAAPPVEPLSFDDPTRVQPPRPSEEMPILLKAKKPEGVPQPGASAPPLTLDADGSGFTSNEVTPTYRNEPLLRAAPASPAPSARNRLLVVGAVALSLVAGIGIGVSQARRESAVASSPTSNQTTTTAAVAPSKPSEPGSQQAAQPGTIATTEVVAVSINELPAAGQPRAAQAGGKAEAKDEARPADKPGDKPADKPGDKPADKPQEEPKPEAKDDDLLPFDSRIAEAALGRAAAGAAACGAEENWSGPARVAVTFAPSGKATQVVVEDGPPSGSLAVSCIVARLQGVSVAPFSGGAATVRKLVVVRGASK